MTWPALLLLLTTPTQVSELPSATLTMAQGTVASKYEEQVRVLERRDSIRIGSFIETGKLSGAAIYWQPGLVIYLGEETRIQLSGTSESPDVELLFGRMRTVSRNGATVYSAGTATRIGRGIVRHTVDGTIASVTCESGAAQTFALHSEYGPGSFPQDSVGNGLIQQVNGQAAMPLRDVVPGEPLVFDTRAGLLEPAPVPGLEKPFDVEAFQMQTVAQVSRSQRGSKVPPVPPLPEDANAEDTKKEEDDDKDSKRVDESEQNRSLMYPGDDATRGLGDDLLPPEVDNVPDSEDNASSGANTQVALGTSGINLALGNVSLSTAAGGAGGLFTDANQATNAGMLTVAGAGLPAGANFPGNIHPVTSETIHSFTDVNVVFSDGFPLFRQFWSIGIGTPPTTQVSTGVNTGTSPTPDTVVVPQFGAYIVRLDQYGLTDPASDAAANDTSVSISGLVGANPQNPNIQGATPLLDERAEINDGLTFALGELAVDLNGSTPQLVVRRSDQDRMIVKDPGGNDANDQVTVNTQVTEFVDQADPLFFPTNATVKVPGRGPDLLTNRPSYRTLDPLRKAAATTLMADQLFEYSRRTGQTRFVIDGKILDISGYQGR